MTVAGPETNQELRNSGSDNHPRQDQERRRTLQDLSGVFQAQPRGHTNGQQTGNDEDGVQQPKMTLEGSGGASNRTTGKSYGNPPYDSGSTNFIGAGAVWAKLLEAKQHPPCSSPPCKQVSTGSLVVHWCNHFVAVFSPDSDLNPFCPALLPLTTLSRR